MTAQIDRTLVDFLEDHACRQPAALAFRYLRAGEEESERITYGELWRDGRKIAQYLQERHAPGARLLVVVDAGMDFVRVFVGCLIARIVPVPVKLPRKAHAYVHFSQIALDAGCSGYVIAGQADEATAAGIEALCTSNAMLRHDMNAALREAEPQDLRASASPEDLAFIQYTSGSTGQPKGVMVTHANLLDNQRRIQQVFRHDRSTVFVSWLPMFHDMGLVGCVLHPIYLGVECTLLPPEAFIQRPVRWLRAIGTYGATTSGAPNFAFQHCVDRLAGDDIATLDLATWRVAFNGSEPVKARTLRAFADRFGSAGFDITRFLPCYGMAEATLFVCGKHHDPAADIAVSPRAATGENLVETQENAGSQVVAIGDENAGIDIRIVSPVDGNECSSGAVGEIWLAGASVSPGYVHKGQMDRRSLGSVTGYYPTGDLGMMVDGKLFVTGRIKDLIIVRGRNIYPQDIEDAATRCEHPLVTARRTIAFSVAAENGGDERIVLLQELRRRPNSAAELAEARAAVRRAVAHALEVTADEVVFVSIGSLPATTSGKPRRLMAKQLYLAGDFSAELRQAPVDG
jgi:acyl-CoA synthetase (AMP-forming)/AMP-acid ligase II